MQIHSQLASCPSITYTDEILVQIPDEGFSDLVSGLVNVQPDGNKQRGLAACITAPVPRSTTIQPVNTMEMMSIDARARNNRLPFEET